MATIELSLPDRLSSGNSIRYWASRYPNFECDKDDWIRDKIQSAYSDAGHLTFDDLRCLGIWKNGSERGTRHFPKSERVIARETRKAYEAADIEILLNLGGLQYPMASSLMHFALPHKYPIIDRRALATLGMRPEEGKEIYINKQLWEEYRGFCLDRSKHYEVSLRMLDRALWQFDSEDSFWQKYDPQRSTANLN